MNSWVARNFFIGPAYMTLGEPVGKFLKRFEETQWWSEEERLKHQMARLRAVLRHAHEYSPYWREAIDASGVEIDRVDDLDCLRRLPVLTRQDILRSSTRLRSPRRWVRTSTRKTSGSSGRPVSLEKDRV